MLPNTALLRGGVFGDMPPGLPDSQLTILPRTSHTGMVDRTDWLGPMINEFLDATVKETS
jgi:hypothetical protein